jgi:hypothetical protein
VGGEGEGEADATTNRSKQLLGTYLFTFPYLGTYLLPAAIAGSWICSSESDLISLPSWTNHR